MQGIALLVNAEPPLAEIPKDGEHPSQSLERLACGPERKIYFEILEQCRVPVCDAVEVRSATGRTGFLVRCDRSTPRFNRLRLALVHQLGGGLRRNDKRIRLRELQLQITGLTCLVSYRFE